MPSAQSLWSDCAEAWRRYGGISICNTTVYPDMFNFRKLKYSGLLNSLSLRVFPETTIKAPGVV